VPVALSFLGLAFVEHFEVFRPEFRLEWFEVRHVCRVVLPQAADVRSAHERASLERLMISATIRVGTMFPRLRPPR
jgi:hypothetical protein